MIHIDKSKCVRCGACIRDCVVNVLAKDEDGFPAFRKEDERYCLNCQHCLAVCARGAVTCNDVVFRNAPCMVVASTPKNAPCREADPWIVLSYFDLLARANGLGTCWSGFAVHAFKGMRGIRKALNMPRGYEVGAVLLFGVPAVEYARVPHPRPMPVEVQ